MRDITMQELRGLFFKDCKGHLFMLGTAYLDDSADPDNEIVFVAAGFFGPDGGGEWKRLRREWRRVLKPHKIPYYRTYDWRTLTGSFQGLKNKWGQDRARKIADDIRKKLEDVIESGPVIAGFGMGINLRDFWEVDAMPEARSNPRWMRECHDYQTSAFRHMFCSLTLTMTTEVDPELLIAFVCDDSTHYKKIKRGFDRIKQKFPDLGAHMVSCAPMDDKRIPELQMADMLAEVVREATAKSIANNMAWTPPYCLKRKSMDFKCWHRDGMLKFLKGEEPGA